MREKKKKKARIQDDHQTKSEFKQSTLDAF